MQTRQVLRWMRSFSGEKHLLGFGLVGFGGLVGGQLSKGIVVRDKWVCWSRKTRCHGMAQGGSEWQALVLDEGANCQATIQPPAALRQAVKWRIKEEYGGMTGSE